LAFAQLFSTCAPNVGPHTLAAVASYESNTDPWTIGDNTAHRGYHFTSRDEAERAARALVAAGHNIDLGLMQINSVHLGENGLSLENVFEPCTNVETGAGVLSAAYRRAAAEFGPGQTALRHALSAYNTGSLFAGTAYANGVAARARALHLLTSSAAEGAFAAGGTVAVQPGPERPEPPAVRHAAIGDGERTGGAP
jgi:type IV secretion system protein VirB1